MARRRDPDFLNRLVGAGLRVFSRQGLTRARMADVARELGVAQGTLYNYVESKEALFYLLVLSPPGGASLELPDELPIAAPSATQLEASLAERIGRDFALPLLDAALTRKKAPDLERELEEVVQELWAATEHTRDQATALERSAIDRPDLFGIFLRFRRELFARYERYLATREHAGQLTPLPDHRVAARFLVETVTFFARHRHLDPDRSLLPDEATIESSAIDLLLRALIGPAPRGRGSSS